MNPIDALTPDDVTRWLGVLTVERGRGYLSEVSALEVTNGALSAKVQGSRSQPYRVTVQLMMRNKSPAGLYTQCTCPVGFHCKHAAAALLAWIVKNERSDRPRAQVLAWVDQFRQRKLEHAGQAPARKPSQHALRYLLHFDNVYREYLVQTFKVRLSRDGQVRSSEPWSNIERGLLQPPGFVDETDIAILRLLWMQRDTTRALYHGLRLSGPQTQAALEKLVESRRTFIDAGLQGDPLRPGGPRQGQVEWHNVADGKRMVGIRIAPPANTVLPVSPLWYIDDTLSEAGILETEAAPELVAELLRLPPLTPAESVIVADTLREFAPELPAPVLRDENPTILSGKPVPVLHLGSVDTRDVNWRDYPYFGVRHFDYAELWFRYGEEVHVTLNESGSYVTLEDGRLTRLERDPAAEEQSLAQLRRLGFQKIPPHRILLQDPNEHLPQHAMGLASEEEWLPFVLERIAQLRSEGWEIEMPDDFRHFAHEGGELTLDVDIDSHDNHWLDITPGIRIEDHEVELAPLLTALFEHDRRWLGGELDQIDDQEPIILHDPEFGRVRVPAQRLKPLVRTLVDLFDAPEKGLRVSRLDAARLDDLDLPGRGRDIVGEIAAKLRNTEGIRAVNPPADFQATLRPYQLEGLAWLQHLSRNDLAGILADDMGLGKTAQALAHLLTEKHAGRLALPALVILPTSLIFNWQKEAERFAPSLRVLNLHGPDRHARFDELGTTDVALTTYPLLWRDSEALCEREWSHLILDEAQTVKNAASKAAQVIRKLRSKHRLGLTGTPLENHLGELWAQFDFLLPGFLGNHKSFTKLWRTPIEKHGDQTRRALLAARIKPFILRRKKEDVATELPPKTIIVRSVALEGAQRDLYETVRAAMDDKIRNEIASKGFARSHIVILDALLKLRQVCCDPRLLKTADAAKVKERAKLDLLMNMVPELIDEGRRILIFSQFTQMLALIAGELDRARISWVSLTGDTRDRRTPVEDFQAGRAPVFLISLKAGGVGLNLTAADTVIHYDPWWNPAAENQATDRAHRIGQDKPVFVFKLICDGSIEERILALQEKKAQLAAGVLSEDANALAKFGESDVAALLAPLPPVK